MMRAGTVLLCLSAALPAPFASGSGVNHGPDVPGPWGLTVDYLKDPVGIDGDAPRFSWKLPAGMKSQSAFQIDAGIWKTDRIVSGESVNAAVWKGPALVSSQRVRQHAPSHHGDTPLR